VITNIPFLAFSTRLFRGVLWSAQACAQASLRAPLQLIIRNPRIFRYALRRQAAALQILVAAAGRAVECVAFLF
jgi:hypothetical protein